MLGRLSFFDNEMPKKLRIKREYYFLILILLLALAVRLWDLNARSLWFDEAFEYWSAQVSVLSLPETIKTAIQPPLYTFLLHFWLKVSSQPIWLRFLSVVLSLFTMMGVMALTYKIAGFYGAIIAGILMALLPTEVRYAQEIGEYALMECMLIWSLYFLYESVERPTHKRLALWGLFSVLSLYSHYGAAIIVLPTTLAVLAENALHRQWRDIMRRMWVLLGISILVFPLFFYFLQDQLQRQSPGTHDPIVGVAEEVLRLVSGLSDTFNFLITGSPFSNVPNYLVWIPMFTIFLLSLLVLAFGSKSATRIISWFWISFITYYLFVRAGVYAYGYYGFRYGLVLMPLFIVLISVVFVNFSVRPQLPKRIPTIIVKILGILTFVAVLAIIILSIYSLPNRTLSEITRPNADWPETQDMREIVQYWIANRNPDEQTYIYYGAIPAFRYYLRLEGYEPNVSLPSTWYMDCWKESTHDYCTSGDVFYGQWIKALPPNQKYNSIKETMGEMPTHLWIIFSHIYPGEDEIILKSLSSEYEIVENKQYQDASVYYLREK